MKYDYDLAILGAGPGGYEAAIRAAKGGLKVALIEKDELGGTCLNRGCIPTKALLHGAQLYHEAKNGSAFGFEAGSATIDYKKLAGFKDSCVERLKKGIAFMEKKAGVEVITGFGVITSQHSLNVGSRTVTFDKLIIAVGSSPAVPPIPGANGEGVLTSDGVLAFDALPNNIVIIGGGVIGVEFATLFGMLGAGVTIVEMLDEIIPGVDGDIRSIAVKSLKKLGVKIITGAKVTAIEGTSPVTVSFERDSKPDTASGDVCAICAGRRPNTGNIGLEACSINAPRGFIEVDERMRTNVENVYAIGDAVGKIQLAHVATHQGYVAVDSILGRDARMSYAAIPACVYMSPELAYVGLAESEALKSGRRVKTGTFNVAAGGRCAVMNEREGIIKLVSDATTGEILGCQIIAPRATDLISEVVAVMKCEGTVEELALAVHPHPTVSEIVWEAAKAAE
ncbi:MAG: dihydrolipoyl dehydrogenase [Clostridia bacterium]|nr:dihydrolipoyl dehydrogenase [Clostridia bacterium]